MPAARNRTITAIFATLILAAVTIIAVGSQPSACAACHRTIAAKVSSGAHADADCYACHLDHGLWSWPGFKFNEITAMYPGALGGEPDGPAAHTSRQSCVRCHAEILTRETERNGLRLSHATCAIGSTCDGCHSSVAHGTSVRWITEPQMEDCIGCHRQEHASTECDLCHAGKSTAERLTKGSWAVTHGPAWRATHGMGDLRTCDVCHESKKCASCHELPIPHPLDFGATHSEVAAAKPKTCGTCHDRTTFCDACHGMAMPHPKSFLEAHPDVATSVDDQRCLKCHRRDDCTRCHVAHVHPGSTDGNLKSSLPKAGD